jgi:hypothetical protein
MQRTHDTWWIANIGRSDLPTNITMTIAVVFTVFVAVMFPYNYLPQDGLLLYSFLKWSVVALWALSFFVFVERQQFRRAMQRQQQQIEELEQHILTAMLSQTDLRATPDGYSAIRPVRFTSHAN